VVPNLTVRQSHRPRDSSGAYTLSPPPPLRPDSSQVPLAIFAVRTRRTDPDAQLPLPLARPLALRNVMDTERSSLDFGISRLWTLYVRC